MIASDAQKYFTLRFKRDLITNGMYRFIRHPNYLGEMMTYGNFALMVWHWLPFVVLAWVWGGPVPWVSRWKNGRCFRHPRTTNERRANYPANTTREILEDNGIAFKIRPKRGWHRLPTSYDDIFLRYQRTWKEHRRTRWKNADGINRRINSLPFWDR